MQSSTTVISPGLGVVILKVGERQLSHYDPVPIVEQPEPDLVFSHVEIIQGIKIEKVETILDLGGVGDCFILCVNEAIASWGLPVHSVDDIYSSLGIPINTYLSEDSIPLISSLYKVSIVVSSIVDRKLYFNRFGLSDRTIFIHNDFPSHYYLYKRSLASELPQHPQVSIEKNTVEPFELVGEKISHIEVDQSFDENPEFCIVEESNISYLTQYVQSRMKIKNRGLALEAADSKAYYKLRHNTFKTTFLSLLGLASTEERPFTDIGIDSKRTPDLLHLYGGVWILIEFTVVKNRSSALINKQSKTKYDYEVSLMRERGMNCISFYPTLALSSEQTAHFDVLELSRLLGYSLIDDPESVLNTLHEDLNQLEFNISEFMPELLLNEEVTVKVSFDVQELSTESFKFVSEVKLVGAKRKRKQTLFQKVKKNSVKLERELKRMPQGKYKIAIITKTNNIHIIYDSEGIGRNTLLTLLQNLSSDLIDYVKVVGNFDDSDNPFEKFGDPSLSGSYSRSQESVVSFDTENYENYYFSKLRKNMEYPPVPGLLADSVLETQIETVEQRYNDGLTKLRGGPNLTPYNKNVFIFPIADDLIPGEFEKWSNFTTRRPVLNLILSKITTVSHSEKIVGRDIDYDNMNKILKKQSIVSKKLSALVSDSALLRDLKKFKNKDKIDFLISDFAEDKKAEILKSLEDFNTVRKEVSTAIGEDTRTKYRNRVSVSKAFIDKNWDIEMEHFMEKKGTVKVCEEQDMTDLKTKFDNLLEFLFAENTSETEDNIFSDTVPLGINFSKILPEMVDHARPTFEYLKKTNIMHNLLLISRMCYTLLYYSNIKLNRNDFVYDNLGYKDVMLVVKGGKKVIATKKSRLFSLIFPISSDLKWLYKSKYTEIIVSDDKTYCVFPWQNYFFPMVKKGIELYYTFGNFYTCSFLESNLTKDVYNRFISMKVLNMFSQRRKVEIWLGSFRYLYLNSLSTHTSVLELIDSMVDYDYDIYFYYLQRLFASHYKTIYSNATNLKIYDMLTGETVDNFDLCSEKFEEAMFMTMAPFERSNEHLRNMKSILETHWSYVSKYSLDPHQLLQQSAVTIDQDNYFQELFSDDFKFDPKLCFCIGKFAGDYLKRMVTQEATAQTFTKILLTSFTEISTSKGMRDSKGKFWGKKGHDVLFSNDETANVVKNFINELPPDYKKFAQITDSLEKTFKDVIEELSDVDLEFDMKDKEQWRGSREIYVMTETTKILQQPLEKFFKYLCQWTPNELIHKQSHIRPKFIHSQVFEFITESESRTYCTLDCRKWAPKSNLWKYYFFVNGMGTFLPPEFLKYFNKVWNLMFTKKIRFQAKYVEIMLKNENTKHLAELLAKRDDGDFELVMPYSFMMGIFNYLSSLLHAMSQLYFNEKIAQKLSVNFNLIAHSDDSGGVIISKSERKNIQTFRLYELFQKGCNHLLSKKKSSLSSKFFEMISIMYANKRLIPMTHKFLANISFEPKGKGWAADISTVVSKVIEIFSNGGTMLQCYLSMIAMGEMIRKMYHLPRIKTLSRLPIQFGGLFNMHPIHLILLGADAQEIMLDTVEDKVERTFRINSFLAITGEYFPGKGSTVNYLIPYFKRHEQLDIDDDDAIEKMKLISSVIPKRTLGKKLAHFSMLKDSSYVYSLSGVDMSQIYTATLFSNSFMLKHDGQRCDMRKFVREYSAMNILNYGVNETDYPYSQFHNYMKASEGIRIRLDSMTITSTKTCKPITYNTFQNIGLGLKFSTLNEIIAFNSKHDLKFLFQDTRRMEVLTDWVKSSIPNSDSYDVLELLQRLSSKDLEKVRSSYNFLPSGVSVDTVERFWTYINFYCTRRYLISNKKPQLFTVDAFKTWSQDYDSLKHYYLLLKVALNSELKISKISGRLRENAQCDCCSYPEVMVNMVDEIVKFRELSEYSKLVTNLPFAIYNSPQTRSINVWYGPSDFTLYTKYGAIVSMRNEYGLGLVIHLHDENYLDQMFYLYENFAKTRGILTLEPTYDVNDTPESKIGYSDLNRPMVVPPGFRGMMITNSRVLYQEPRIYEIQKVEGKYLFEGEPADFEIYQNYDINPDFYTKHKLSNIKDLLIEDDLKVDLTSFKKSVLTSNLYKTIMIDPTHTKQQLITKKYEHKGLLGAPGSLSYALAKANAQNKIVYRSSVNPKLTNKAILESQSYKDIPVLDLIDECSFARMSYKEKLVIEKIITEETINENEEVILSRLTEKMGIKPTLSAITLYRNVFRTLSYLDVSSLDDTVLEDFVYTMLKHSLECIEETSKYSGKSENYHKGVKNAICLEIAMAIDFKATNPLLAELFVKTYSRAHYDNSVRFWDLRKGNIYTALYTPNKDNFQNQCVFLEAVLNYLDVGNIDWRKKVFSIRKLTLAKMNGKKSHAEVYRSIKRNSDEDTSLLPPRVNLGGLEERNYYCPVEEEEEIEEVLDYITSGDDPEEFEEREWDEDGDELEMYMFSHSDLKSLIVRTLFKDLSSVTLISLFELPDYPWLGYCNQFVQYDNHGVKWHISQYPGNSKPRLNFEKKKLPKIERISANPIPVTKSVEKVLASSDNKVNRNTLFSFDNESDLYNYQCDVLKNAGFRDPEKYSRRFFKLSEVSSQEHFWAMLFKRLDDIAVKKSEKYGGRNLRTSILPGFTGNLRDKKIRAELRSFFGDHVESVTSGNHRLTPSSYKNIMLTIKRQYKTCEPHERGLLTIILSIMVDCVICEKTDDWFVDPILDVLNEIDEARMIDTDYTVAPEPLNAELTYVEGDLYEDEDFE
nr:MAG: RNA-dependent RNA polymerase [Sanya bunya-like virus 16]